MWHNNVRVFFTFVFAGILCSFLSNKAFSFAHEMGTTIQVFEPFIWTFGDAKSILLISILLILLFSDMPILGASAPFYLIRIDRKTWVWGQLIYLTIATLIYILFILCITILLSMKNSYIENIWSETAVILGYSDAGKEIALPTFIKTLEMSYPYQCARTIFLLMLFYTLVLTLLMLLISLLYGKKASITVAFGFSLYGLLLNPELIKQVLKLPDKMMYKANIAVGWFSPLNQATYHMHSFGYDFLPSLYQTYFVFFMLIAVLVTGILSTMRHYNYNFIGSDIL